MWIERLMAGISLQHVLSYNPVFTGCDRRSNDGSWTDVEYCRDI